MLYVVRHFMRALIFIILVIFFGSPHLFGQTDIKLAKQIISDIIPTKQKAKPLAIIDEAYIIPEKDISIFESRSSLANIISSEQIAQISLDIKESTTFLWTKDIFDSNELVTLRVCDSLSSVNTSIYFYKYSKPFFTSDKMFCLISWIWKRGSFEQGWSMQLYKRENNHWNSKIVYRHLPE